MTTLTAEEKVDWERIRNTWDLPRWAKVQVECKRQGETEPYQAVAIFQKMDWMYGLWKDEQTGEPLIFNWRFKQVDQDCFIMLDDEDEE